MISMNNYILGGVYDPGYWPFGYWPNVTGFTEIIPLTTLLSVVFSEVAVAYTTFESTTALNIDVENDSVIATTFSEEVEL